MNDLNQGKSADNRRQCGSCVACCEGWLASKIVQMTPMKPCRHKTSAGCGIYENRPVKPCVEFKCAWLQYPDRIPEKFRPNNCGAIVLFDNDWNGWKVIRAIPTGPKIPPATLEWLMKLATERKTPLIFGEFFISNGVCTGKKRLGYGPPEFVQAVKTITFPEDLFML